MNCNDIAIALETLKVNSRGSIRGKNRLVDNIHSMHLKKLDKELMDIRVFVASALKMVDEFIYKKQIS
jgi:hypothetical protein